MKHALDALPSENQDGAGVADETDEADDEQQHALSHEREPLRERRRRRRRRRRRGRGSRAHRNL